MTSIFPYARPVAIGRRDVPVAKTWAWDTEALEYKLKNGKMYEVYEDEAIKIWIWKIIATERKHWPVYTHAYGNDYLTLIGHGYSRGFVEAEAKRIIKDAIMQSLSDYVLAIQNLRVTFVRRHLTVSLTVDTIYSKKAVVAFDI